MKRSKILAVAIAGLVGSAGAALVPTTAHGEIYVLLNETGKIAEYSTSGTPVNTSLVSGLGQYQALGLARSGSNLFVTMAGHGFAGAGTIGEYTTSGATVNASLISGLYYPYGVAVSGSTLFVANYGGFQMNDGSIGEYTLGANGTVLSSKPSLITELDGPIAVAVSGSHLFVANRGSGTIGEYTLGADGSVVSSTPSLITVNLAIVAMAVSGSDLFVAGDGGEIGKYTTAGGTVNADLIQGIDNPEAMAVLGSDLFVTTYSSSGKIAEYTTSGATVNTSLVSLVYPAGIVVVSDDVPEPASLALLALGGGVLLARRRKSA